jgi:hypothetical protein
MPTARSASTCTAASPASTSTRRPRRLLGAARAALDTLHGRWSVDWKIEDGRFRLEVRVPPGCSAGLDLPGDVPRDLGPGTHEIERELDELR